MCLRGRLRGRFGESGGGTRGRGGKGGGVGVPFSLDFFYIMERASDKGLSFFCFIMGMANGNIST